MMADNRLLNDNDVNGVDGDGEIFVYTGGEQEGPRDVKRVRIAENVDTIQAGTFQHCAQLIEVEGHNKLKKIEARAFLNCPSLRSVWNMTGVIEIEECAFSNCKALSELEFDKLEIIGRRAFGCCKSLRSIDMPSVKRVRKYAFMRCGALTDVMFGQNLERIEVFVFFGCTALRSISIPLKDNLIIDNNAFSVCTNLSRVDTLAGGIHKTISSLHLESWRDEMEEEIDRINRTLPNDQAIEKTIVIQQWITRVFSRMEQYKSEQQTLLKEAMTLLELALWKTKILDERGEQKCNVDVATKKVKTDDEAARNKHRVTCGASIVIKNVLPFLALK